MKKAKAPSYGASRSVTVPHATFQARSPGLSKEDLVELRVSWLPDMGPLLWHSREDSSTADQLPWKESGSFNPPIR